MTPQKDKEELKKNICKHCFQGKTNKCSKGNYCWAIDEIDKVIKFSTTEKDKQITTLKKENKRLNYDLELMFRRRNKLQEKYNELKRNMEILKLTK